MDTQNSIVFVNSLGEKFVLGEMVYFYIINSRQTSIRHMDNWQACCAGLSATYTAIGKTPGSALILLNEYYEKFGYPNENKQ